MHPVFLLHTLRSGLLQLAEMMTYCHCSVVKSDRKQTGAAEMGIKNRVQERGGHAEMGPYDLGNGCEPTHSIHSLIHQSICPSIYLPINQPDHPSTHLPIHSIDPSIHSPNAYPLIC